HPAVDEQGCALDRLVQLGVACDMVPARVEDLVSHHFFPFFLPVVGRCSVCQCGIARVVSPRSAASCSAAWRLSIPAPSSCGSTPPWKISRCEATVVTSTGGT